MTESFVTSEVEKEPIASFQPAQTSDHLDRLLMTSDLEEPWYRSLVRSVRELIHPPELPPLIVTSRPIESGELDKLEQPWFKSFIANIKDLVNPPKLPPLEVTSKPVEVDTIWGAYQGGESKSGAVSLLIHVGVIALLFLVFKHTIISEKKKDLGPIVYVAEYKPKLPPAVVKAGGGGGGGQRMPTPVSRGVAPKFDRKVFEPPKQSIPKPLLPVVPTITAQAPQIQAPDYADPLSKMTEMSGGQGTHGLGSGSGGGIGSGKGDGYGPGEGGGFGGGPYRIGGEVSAPSLMAKVEPEYSEEARKAKYSGTVLLSIVVDEHGLPRDIHVVRPLGLGLDEKAIEAVMKWRFRPGMKGGRPVATQAQVEVNFRLL